MNQLALKFPGDQTIEESITGLDPKRFNVADLKLLTPADIINAFIPTIFVIAGLVLFAMLISGGFTIFLSAGNPEKIKKGTAIITNGLVGFLIMFAAYWIIQLVEYSLGLQLL